MAELLLIYKHSIFYQKETMQKYLLNQRTYAEKGTHEIPGDVQHYWILQINMINKMQ